MAIPSEWPHGEDEKDEIARVAGQLLLIPEAPVLLGLLLIGWAYAFPTAVSLLTLLTAAVFMLRLALMLRRGVRRYGRGPVYIEIPAGRPRRAAVMRCGTCGREAGEFEPHAPEVIEGTWSDAPAHDSGDV